MKVLSIDASINNVGYCIFDTNQFSKVERHALKGGYKVGDAVQFRQFCIQCKEKAWKWGTFVLEGSSKSMRFLDLVQQITTEIGTDFDYFISEQPAFYSSTVGQVAAHQNYTIDLAACNYYVAGWFHMDHRKHIPITAITWKGSVPKAVTQKKFFRTFDKEKSAHITEHAIDATMLLHYWLSTTAVHSPLVTRHTSAELIKVLL
jgi:hypothetical protein